MKTVNFLSALTGLSILGFAANAAAQSYRYDDVGRLEKVLYDDGKGVSYTYDGNDNLIQVASIAIPVAVGNADYERTFSGLNLLSWSYSGDVLAFKIQKRPAGTEAWVDAAIVDDPNARSQVLDLDPEVTYVFRVIAVGSGGEESAPSLEVEQPPVYPLYVTTLLDEDDGALGEGEGNSLRELVKLAIPGSTIHFAADLNGQRLALGGAQITIDKSITIDATYLPARVKIDAGGLSRIFGIQSTGDRVTKAYLKGLILQGGAAEFGGAIHNDDSDLGLVDCLVSGNRSTSSGGGIFNGNGGSVFLVDTRIVVNEATLDGGGIYNAQGGFLDIGFSTILGNSSLRSGGGIYNLGSDCQIDRSALLQNSAGIGGGGIHNLDAPILLVNSTVAENSSVDGSGGAFSNNGSGTMIVRHDTIADNTGAGVFNQSPASLVLDNSIVANNISLSNTSLDVQGDFTAVAANLVRSHSGTRLGGPAPITGDPLLGPLGFYGGGSQSMVPLVGSPVLEAGRVTVNTPSIDQESSSRPHGTFPELGSIESRLSNETDLEWLTTSTGGFDPVFRSEQNTYETTVANEVETVLFRPAKGESGQTIELRVRDEAFAEVNSKSLSEALALNEGENLVELKVTAENGSTTEVYSITVIRGLPSAENANLSSLTLDTGTLSPRFDTAVSDYDSFAALDSEFVSIAAIPSNLSATMQVRSNFGSYVELAADAASPPLPLHAGDNVIDIKVTAEDATTIALHSITVTREPEAAANALLTNLAVGAGPLSPTFSPGVLAYELQVSEDVDATTLLATSAGNATSIEVSLNGGDSSSLTSGEATSPLDLAEGSNYLEIKVTAADGVSSQSYFILVTRVTDTFELLTQAGDSSSTKPSISSDCRYVAFSSRASNLVPDDDNGDEDVFVYDRLAGTIERVSVSNEGVEGNRNSTDPELSANGRYVVFQSEATNLVANDTNGENDYSQGRDIFVYDLLEKTIERVSVRQNGGESNQASETPSISGDGRYVAYTSSANNLVSGYANGEVNVYVYDREEQTVVGIPVPFGGVLANRNSLNAAISADGKFVAFEFAVDKSEGNTPGYQYRDIYMYGRATGVVTRITGTKIGAAADGTQSSSPSISADGRFVAFVSNLENLDIYDTNQALDVFVFDRVSGKLRRASSRGVSGGQKYADSNQPSLSGDGRFVAFRSYSPDLVDGDVNGDSDIFVANLESGEISLLSQSLNGTQGDGESTWPAISYAGDCVAFQSQAENLHGSDSNQSADIFVVTTETLSSQTAAALVGLKTNLGSLSTTGTSLSASVPSGLGVALLKPFALGSGGTIEASVNAGEFVALPAGSISSLALAAGQNSIEIKVRSTDGTSSKTYVLTVSRGEENSFFNNADLSGLASSAGDLDPVFASDALIYSASVSNDTSTVTLTPTLLHAGGSIVIGDAPVDSGTTSEAIPLSEGSNTIIVTVTAQDGLTEKTYALLVNRTASVPVGFSNADLVGLSSSVGILSPSFASDLLEYAADVPNEKRSAFVTPTLSNPNAELLVDGILLESGSNSIPRILGVGSNHIVVSVVAQDGVTTKSYILSIARSASQLIQIDEIRLLRTADSQLSVTWRSELGVLYKIEQSTDLVAWSPLKSGIPGAGETTTSDVSISESTFLRIGVE